MLKLVDRYIAKTLLSSIALVVLLLFALHLFILLFNELRIAQGFEYNFLQILGYVLLQAPHQVYLFFPVACLLGCLIGLGSMAGHSELIVLRAAGYSITQIAFAMLKMALLVIISVTIIGETLIPKMMFIAENRKMALVSDGQGLRTGSGLWMRDANSFIHVDRADINESFTEGQLENILQYEFNDDYQLTVIRQAKKARYVDAQWHWYDVQENYLHDNKLSMQTHAQQLWQTQLTPQMLSVASIEPDEMSLLQLHLFIKEQQKNMLRAQNYELTYWKRLVQPLTTCVMILLALPFIFGPLRAATTGARLLIGLACGFTFYVLNQFFTPITVVFQLPPLWGALGPTLFFAVVAFFMLRQVR